MADFDFSIAGVVQAHDAIVRHIGIQWLEDRTQQTSTQQKPFNPQDDSYLYRPNVHPLKSWHEQFPEWLDASKKKGEPIWTSQVIEMTLLGQSLEIMANDPKFLKQIERLKNDEDFWGTLFEFEVAASHTSKEIRVEFVEENTNKTPDLCVKALNETPFWIECKMESIGNNLDARTKDMWHRIQRRIWRYLKQRNLNYQIVITAYRDLEQADVPIIVNSIIEIIEKRFEPFTLLRMVGANHIEKDSTDNFEFQLYKLSEPGDLLDKERFELPVPRTSAYGIFEAQIEQSERDIIVNPRAIQFNPHDISAGVHSVAHAFKRATKQLPQSGPGVIHICLRLTSWSDNLEATVEHVRAYLGKELSGNNNRRVNAVVVMFRYASLIGDGPFQTLQHYAFTIVVEHNSPRSYVQ